MKVYLALLNDGDPPTFYAVPVVIENINGNFYRKDPEVEDFLKNMPDYWLPYADPEELLQVFTIRNNERDKRIEVGDDLYIEGRFHGPHGTGRFLGEVEKIIIEAPKHNKNKIK